MPRPTVSPQPARRAYAPLDAFARALGLAVGVHTLLPDYASPGWGPPAAVGLVGALWLLGFGARAGGFALVLVAKLWTLLLLRDVLTQSMILVWFAALGALGCLAARHSPSGRPRRALAAARLGPGAVLDAVRVLTGLTYLIAALHKLNDGFFDPAVSCAPHAFAQAAARWSLPHPAALDAALPALAVGLEAALGLAVLARSRWIWPLGVVFHLPLTATLAPAFQAVMLVGWVATLTPRQRVEWRRVGRADRRGIAAGALLFGALDLAFAGVPRDLDGLLVVLKVAANGALAAAGLRVVWRARRRTARPPAGAAGRPAAHPPTHRAAVTPRPARAPRPRALALTLGAAWILHGLGPYLGLWYQHTGAMLSNLRVDNECHNAWLFGPGLRLFGDPYLRIDQARFGPADAPTPDAGGLRPARAAALRAGLWSPAALHTMRRNWCVEALRPIALAGTHRGRPFAVPDLCADDWTAHLPTAAVALPGYQAWQKNLQRACATACIH